MRPEPSWKSLRQSKSEQKILGECQLQNTPLKTVTWSSQAAAMNMVTVTSGNRSRYKNNCAVKKSRQILNLLFSLKKRTSRATPSCTTVYASPVFSVFCQCSAFTSVKSSQVFQVLTSFQRKVYLRKDEPRCWMSGCAKRSLQQSTWTASGEEDNSYIKASSCNSLQIPRGSKICHQTCL